MMKETEQPDMVLKDDDNSDCLMFTVRKNTVLISCHIDNTGNEWEVPIETFRQLLREDTSKRKVKHE